MPGDTTGSSRLDKDVGENAGLMLELGPFSDTGARSREVCFTPKQTSGIEGSTSVKPEADIEPDFEARIRHAALLLLTIHAGVEPIGIRKLS